MLRVCLPLLAGSLLWLLGAAGADAQVGGFNFPKPTRFTPARPAFSPSFRVAGRTGFQLNERQNMQFFGQNYRRQNQQFFGQTNNARRQQQQVMVQNSQLRNLQSQLGGARQVGRSPTGHGGTFMNTLHYYQQTRIRR